MFSPRRTEITRFDARKKKSWSSKSGVSEIIGNILILMITVILFSSIMAFVQNMPMPQQLTKATFSAGATFISNGTKVNLTITHAGGASMNTAQTLILVQQDSIANGYNLKNDASLNNALVWKTGMTWSKQLTGTKYTSVITVTVVDLVKHSSVWTSQVTGGTGQNPPVIGQRWVDSDPTTPSADPVRDGENFAFYATITDVDGDLATNQIWIDASQIPGSSSHWAPTSQSGDVFMWSFSYIVSQGITAAQLDGAVILIHAQDTKGHITESTFVMTVTKLPYDTTYNNKTYYSGGGSGVDTSGLFLYFPNKDPALGTAYGIFSENHSSPGTANTSKPTTVFTKDNLVFIQVGSKYMGNVLGTNSLKLSDTRTNVYISPVYTGSSTSSSPFYILSTGSATLFECQFNTSNLPPGTYNLNISMASSPGLDGTSKVFKIPLSIIVKDPNSPISFAPQMLIYKDSARTIPWGSTQLTAFDISQGIYTVYATVKVMDTQASPNPSAQQISISDMNGGQELYGVPPSGTMIPNPITQFNATYYKFDVDLRYNNGNQWLTGANSYSLLLTKFADSNEGLYSLSAPLFIKAASGLSDFFVGEDGVNVGHNNFDFKTYLTYIENNNFFTQNQLFTYQNTPSDKTTYATTAIELADLSGDGSRDALVGQDGSNSLLYFKNSVNTLGGFQAGSSLPRPASDAGNDINWITSGDINGDGAVDFAYVSSANNVVIYNNTYGMTPWLYHAYGSTKVNKIMLVDMNGDGKADLVTLAGGHIYVQDLSKFSGTNTYPVIARIPASDSTSSGITDFDIADMNHDGIQDILTVGTGGDASVNGVWQNNYTINSAPTVKVLNQAATGFSPRIAAGKVLSGTVVSTQKRDQVPLTISENATGAPVGQVDIRMQFNTLATDTDPLLSVVARLASADTESFYAWYSVDSNGNTGMYIPMFAITNKATNNSDGGYVNYTFKLPTMAAGKAIFLRFTDSSNTLGTVTDTLDIDYVAVLSNNFGSYTSQRYQVVSNSPTVYTCVRAGNIMNNADYNLDVVVAMNGAWKAYHLKTPIAGWAVTDASLYVKSTDSLMTYIAPTLFDVVDVNGDGLSDVVVCHLTTVQGTISQMGFYMNVYPTSVFYTVAELGQSGGSGAITVVQTANLQV